MTTRRPHSASLVFVISITVALFATRDGISAPERPNILFLAVDDLNDWVGPLAGHPQARTPNFDRLARSGTLFTNVAYNEKTHEVWWEGRTKEAPADLDGWLDWKGERIADRAPECAGDPWAHPNSRFTTTLANVPNVAADYADPKGVPIDGIIFGGRTRDREPLIRAISDLAEGVYDGLTLGAEATFAADGLDGQLRYDPMSMRPFMSYPEGDYAAQWLKIVGGASELPIFAHVNWFQRDPEDGHFLWPGFRENLRALLWLMQLKNGEVSGVATPVGIVPSAQELSLEGSEVRSEDLAQLLDIDLDRWQQEIAFREQYLGQFHNLPQEIWDAHRRVAAEVEAAVEARQ